MSKSFLLFLCFLFAITAIGQDGIVEMNQKVTEKSQASTRYFFDGHFPKESLNLVFNGNPMYHHKVYVDTSSKRTLADIRTKENNLDWQNPFQIIGETGKIYWLKARFYGSSYFKGNQLLHISQELGKDGFSFDYIDAYTIKNGTLDSHQRTGRRIPLKERSIDFWASFIKLEVEPTDTLDLWVRMEGANPEFIMNGIGFHHIDKASLFPRQVDFAWKNGLFYGVLFIQFLFFLLLFFIEKERLHFYFCCSILGYLLAAGFSRDNFNQFVSFPYLYQYRVVWSSIGTFLLVFGGLKFVESYFSYSKNSIFSRWVLPGLILFGALVTLLDTLIYAEWVDKLKGILFMLFLLCLMLMILKARKKQPKLATYYFLAYLPAIIICLIYFSMRLWNYSALQNQGGLLNLFSDLLKASGVWLVTFLALSIGNRTNQLKEEKARVLQKSIDQQKQINQAITRFVPNEFLQALGKTDITQVQLGDNTQREITIFFSDIQDYTSLSEQMSPEENFSFVNACNSRMGPIIQNNNGFVNQYLGDGIMALFPQSPADALRAAIQTVQELHKYNLSRQKKGKKTIKVGMGIHIGPLIMGITGDKNRLDATTISDSVNSAARIESLTRQFGASILLSEVSLNKLSTLHEFKCRYLGKVQVKGKQQPIKIYECFNGEESELMEAKLITQSVFEEGILQYEEQAYQKAIESFEIVLDRNPLDRAAQFFLEDSERNVRLSV